MDDQVKHTPEEGVPEDEEWTTPLTEEALKEVSGGMCQPSSPHQLNRDRVTHDTRLMQLTARGGWHTPRPPWPLA